VGRLKIPISDDRAIRRGAGVTHACRQIGAVIATAAGAMSGGGHYGVEQSTGTDRARINVFAEDSKAEGAERGAAPPLQRAAMQAEKL